MRKRFSWIDIIIIFWAYFLGILIASKLFKTGIITITNPITQGVIAVIIGFAFVYLTIKIIDLTK